MKRFFLFALVATMFAACVTDETQDVAVELAPETLTVSFEDADSRIQLQNGKTVWTKGDLVSVFYRSNANQKWQYQGETGERTGDLKQVAAGSATATMPRVVIVYPYSDSYYLNHETYNIEASLPATQHYLKDSYGVGGNIMVSSSEYNQFTLKSVCGWLKIQLTGNGEKVKSIKLRGNNGEQVAGQIYINSADATATLASEMGVADDEENGTGGNLVFDDTILKEVTLDCGEGVTLGAEPTVFYIALPPQTFEKGLIIDVESVDGGKMTKSTSNAITIARNTIQPMTVFEFVYSNTPASTVPANNEIWYTSLDDNIVTPNATDVFGVNIVSNTYENGKGVITFDGEVTMIGEKAFFECSTLASISIPTTITKMYADAFRTCSSLKRVDIFDLSAWCKIRFVNNAGASPLCEGADLYLNGELLTDLVIPSDITKLYFAAFFGCTSLKSVTIPSHVTSIHKSAFNRCTSLTNATIDNGVTSIGEYAFYNCTSLTSVTIGNRVTEIGGYAFKGCTSLTSVTIPDSVTEIGDYAFENCSSLTDITIGNGVTSIGVLAFEGCSNLTSVHISDLSAWCKISYPGGGANPICYANNLYLNGELVTELTIPSDITEIKNHTFRRCSSLTSVTIPNNVTSIGSFAFEYCESLTSVTIGNSVTSIGYEAFYKCTSLKEVYCKATTPPAGGSDMFSKNASGRKIYVPAASVEAYKSAQYWSDYADYITTVAGSDNGAYVPGFGSEDDELTYKFSVES